MNEEAAGSVVTAGRSRRRRAVDGSPERSRRWVTALQVLSAVNLALVFVQAVTAGNVLTGNRGLLVVHEVIGANVIGFVSIAQIIVAVLARRAHQVSTWVVVVAVLAFGLVVAQVFLGFDDRMALHVPNALAVFATQGVLLVAPGRHPTRGARTP